MYIGENVIVVKQKTIDRIMNCLIIAVPNTWSRWSEWGSCSRTCDWGTKQRTRSCETFECIGPKDERTDCYSGRCKRKKLLYSYAFPH